MIYDDQLKERYVKQEDANYGATGPTGATGTQGETGATGPAGADGDDGKTWYGGTSDPSSGTGVDGDWYINRTTWHVWEKVSGTWADRGTIKGADGEGAGDVVGPASAVNERIAVFDGVTGKLLKDGGQTIAGLEPAIGTKKTAFNVDFGTASGTACQGNDSRLSDARTPTSHNNTAHSETYITSAGVTYEALNGNSDIGSTSGTVCAGNDARLSDARTPTNHNLVDTTKHPVSGLTTGHFLKATGATTYAFGAHGLTNTDVGAAATSHAHGNVTTDGKIGTTASVPIITGTGGVLQAGSFGTASGTFAEGNHTHTGYLSDVVSDTTPQLGGSLDVNGQAIVSVSNGNIAITPNGTGAVSMGKTVFNSQAYYDEEINATSTTFDLSAGNRLKKTMSANVTMSITVPSGPAAGFIRLIGHSTNTYTIAWPSSSPKCVWLTTAMTSITAGKSTVVSWMYDGTNLWLSCPGLVTTP